MGIKSGGYQKRGHNKFLPASNFSWSRESFNEHFQKVMNIQNIIREIKKENEEKIRIKKRIRQPEEEVKRLTKDFLKTLSNTGK